MSQAIQLTLTGYRVEDALPEVSGDYVCNKVYFNGNGELWTLHYSAKHRAWNVYDHSTDEEVAKWRIDEVTHWFRLPEAPDAKGDVVHG